jgi:hypothetical protein
MAFEWLTKKAFTTNDNIFLGVSDVEGKRRKQSKKGRTTSSLKSAIYGKTILRFHFKGEEGGFICALESSGLGQFKGTEGGEEKKVVYIRRFGWEWTPPNVQTIFDCAHQIKCCLCWRSAGSGDILPAEYSNKSESSIAQSFLS